MPTATTNFEGSPSSQLDGNDHRPLWNFAFCMKCEIRLERIFASRESAWYPMYLMPQGYEVKS
jgi:hypothetical protein